MRFQLTVCHSIEGVCSFRSVAFWRLPALVGSRHVVPSKACFALEGINAAGKVRVRLPLYTGRQYEGERPPFRWVWAARLRIFFEHLGQQNGYGFTGIGAPYPKPHLWKTRFGFSTAWNLACILAEPAPEGSQKPAMPTA